MLSSFSGVLIKHQKKYDGGLSYFRCSAIFFAAAMADA